MIASETMTDAAAHGDTAAFFASKKKKKKAFKFNANLVDASSVTQTVHVEAPALSTDHEYPISGVVNAVAAVDVNDKEPADEEQWDDAAAAASSQSRKGPHPSSSSAEVLDMKSLDSRRGDQSNIAEKLRVEETKAQLAQAREGMEREAAKLKEEQERKDQLKKDASVNRFAAASASVGGASVGGKWVPPHMRGGVGSSPALSAVRMGGPYSSQKLDVQDDELFPDLASADKILEKKEKEQQLAFKVPKKTPVGGGATWASKPKITPQAAEHAPSPPEKSDTVPDATPPATVSQIAAPPEPSSTPAPTISPPKETTAPKPVVKKKKKKDLSTFKPN